MHLRWIETGLFVVNFLLDGPGFVVNDNARKEDLRFSQLCC
jgi:hypothetical protein